MQPNLGLNELRSKANMRQPQANQYPLEIKRVADASVSPLDIHRVFARGIHLSVVLNLFHPRHGTSLSRL